MFRLPEDPDGADNTWGTADDGLTLHFNAPVVNTGSNNLARTTYDVLRKDRIRDGIVDLGAYEQAFKDQDLDGFSDLAELFAVTRMDDPQSHPGFTPRIDLNNQTLVFFPKTEETYQVERSADLINWQPFGDPVSWEDAVVILPLFVEAPALPREFFRVIRLSP